MPRSYHTLYSDVLTIASKYPFGHLLKGFTPELINILMTNHKEKLKGADSYEKCEQMLNEALAPKKVNDFVPDEADRLKLYDLFAEWILTLLVLSAVV
jgi:hypothetical protein